MKKHLAILITTTILASLSGCAIKRQPVNVFYPVDSASLDAQTKLAEAAISTSSSLNRLAALEKANQPQTKLAPPMNIDHMNHVGLGALTSIDWTGPIEQVAKELALISHYKFRVLGKRPAIPVLVAVYAVNMPVGDILRDINFQAGSKADVVTYPSHRTIELRYRHTNGNGPDRSHTPSWK